MDLPEFEELPELVGEVFGRIAAARAAQRLRASDLFVAWDADKDGRISSDDIRRGIARLGVRVGSDFEWVELAARLPLISFADFRELLVRHASSHFALEHHDPTHVAGATIVRRRPARAGSQSPRSSATTPRGPIEGASVSIPTPAAPSPSALRSGSRN
jgi:hypothetical protein